jgi:DNA-binding NarL/FixJ family response regulator
VSPWKHRSTVAAWAVTRSCLGGDQSDLEPLSTAQERLDGGPMTIPLCGKDSARFWNRRTTITVAHGRSNREIARALSLSEKTVNTHVSANLGKLGVQDHTQATLRAVRCGPVN